MVENAHASKRRMPRPAFLWILMLGLLVFAAFNGLRLYGAIHSRDYLKLMEVLPGPQYIAWTGGIFAVLFLASFLALLFRWRSAIWMTRVAVVLYAAWYWADRLLLARSRVETVNTWYMACATAVLVLFTLASLAAWRAMERQ